jgi:WD40 repeat protein
VFSLSDLPPPVFGSLAMSPDGSTLVARGKGEIILASLSGRTIRRIALAGEDVQQLGWRPDSRRLVTTMADRSIRLWDAASGEAHGKLGPHVGPPTVALYSADGTMIASADTRSLHLWDAESRLLLARMDVGVMSATFAHHRPRLVTATLAGQVSIWDLPRDRWARPLPGHQGQTLARYAADGSAVVTADADHSGRGHVRVWNSETGELERSSPLEGDPNAGVAVSADGGRLAHRSRDGRIRIVDAATGKAALVIDVGGERVHSLAFSPDGRQLAAGFQGEVRLWSAQDGSAINAPIRNTDNAINVSVTFSPDGNQILATSEGAPARILDSRTGRLLRQLPRSMAHAGAYSPDGRRIVTGGRLHHDVPRIWDAATGTLVAELGRHEHGVEDAAFSPDAALVATADGDGAIRVWDAASGDELRSIRGPAEVSLPTREMGYERSVEFSPDGRRLLATGPSYALIWNVEVDRRSSAEVDALVAARSPWRLVDGRLVGHERRRNPVR